MVASQPVPQRRIFFLSLPHTGSHLLERMLSVQPNTLWKPLLPSSQTVPNRVLRLKQAFQAGFTDLETFLRNARESNTQAFFHGHPNFMISPVLASQYIYNNAIIGGELDWAAHSTSTDPKPLTNSTILPDAFFLSQPTVAIFSIRNPYLMIPSLYRATDKAECRNPSTELLRFSGSIRWSRMLCDCFISHGLDAVVVDAKEYMSATTLRPFMEKLCAKTGLDNAGVIYEWPGATEEELAKLPEKVAGILKDILDSEGVRTDKDAGEVVPEREEKKWKEEFGEEVAGVLKGLVAEMIGEYDYMREKAITVAE